MKWNSITETYGRVKKSHQNLQKPAQKHTVEQPVTTDEKILKKNKTKR